MERSRVALRRRESPAAVGTDGDDRPASPRPADAGELRAAAAALATAAREAETAERARRDHRGSAGTRARVLERPRSSAKLAQVVARATKYVAAS